MYDCVKTGDAGDRTRGLSHAKRTLYHWATSPCCHTRLILLLITSHGHTKRKDCDWNNKMVAVRLQHVICGQCRPTYPLKVFQPASGHRCCCYVALVNRWLGIKRFTSSPHLAVTSCCMLLFRRSSIHIPTVKVKAEQQLQTVVQHR